MIPYQQSGQVHLSVLWQVWAAATTQSHPGTEHSPPSDRWSRNTRPEGVETLQTWNQKTPGRSESLSTALTLCFYVVVKDARMSGVHLKLTKSQTLVKCELCCLLGVSGKDASSLRLATKALLKNSACRDQRSGDASKQTHTNRWDTSRHQTCVMWAWTSCYWVQGRIEVLSVFFISLDHCRPKTGLKVFQFPLVSLTDVCQPTWSITITLQ